VNNPNIAPNSQNAGNAIYYSGVLPIGYIFEGKYRIEQQLGQGGMGDVYKVTEVANGHIWALKLIQKLPQDPTDRKDALDGFKREGDILRLSTFGGLPRIREQSTDEHNPYIVMEYVGGQTLKQILDKSPSFLDYQQVLGWAIQLTEVLNHLHTALSQKIIYRDLKPQNVMLNNSNQIKLIDFGISRFYNPLKTSDTIYLGTPGYAPPELRNFGLTDERSDIYSLGITLHHLLTKEDPSQQTTALPLKPISFYTPGVPREFEEIILKMTQPLQDNRYASMIEARSMLQQVPVKATPITDTKPYIPHMPSPMQEQLRTIILDTPPELIINPHQIDVGKVSRKIPQREIPLHFSGVGARRESISGNIKVPDNVSWLTLSASTFGAHRPEIKVIVNPAKVPFGRSNFMTLNFISLYRQVFGPTSLIPGWLPLLLLLGLFVGSWFIRVGQYFLLVAIALFGVQLWLWFHMFLWKSFVPAANKLTTPLIVKSNGGNNQINVTIETAPSNIRILFSGIIATLMALAPVLIILLVVLRRVNQ